MFHKIKVIAPLTNKHLKVQFVDGNIKMYDFNPLIENHANFHALNDNENFDSVTVDQGG